MSRMTPAEEAAQADIKRVALAQPHRRGDDDPRCADPLWHACKTLRLRDELYSAGLLYGEISRNYKASIGLAMGNGSENGMGGEDDPVRARLAKERYLTCVNVLRGDHAALEHVCYDQMPMRERDRRSLSRGLYRLAVHLGALKLGINTGKPG